MMCYLILKLYTRSLSLSLSLSFSVSLSSTFLCSMSSTSIQSSTKYLSSGPSSVPVSHNHQTNSPIPGTGIRVYSTTIASKRSLPSKGPPSIGKNIPCVAPPLPRDPRTSLKSKKYLHQTDSHALPHSHSSNPKQLSFSPISTVSPRTPTNLQDAFKLTDWLRLMLNIGMLS